MAQPVWKTPAGSLGTIPEGAFYELSLLATADATVYYQLLAGALPPGMQIDDTGLMSGNPSVPVDLQGVPLPVSRDTISRFAIRAYTTLNGLPTGKLTSLTDRTFSLTITDQNTVIWSTPAGTISTYFDGVQISDLDVVYTGVDSSVINAVTLIAGALPPGLTVSTAGVISGYITPDPARNIPTTTTYSFTLRVANALSSDVRTFSLLIWHRSRMTADNTEFTSDDTFVTADASPQQPPIIITPTGTIGSIRSDNYYAFQFVGFDFFNNPIEFIATTALPPGLALDPNTGWLYGFIPYNGVAATTYSFEIIVRETNDPVVFSNPYSFSLTVEGPVTLDIEWLTPLDPVERARTPSSLGLIDNGATSTFYVEAVNISGIPIQYRLLVGSDSDLPQGLELLSSGHIAGRVSFDTFAVDGGTTTFDVELNTVSQPTTFDMVATFTVNAFSTNGLINASKTFSITVVRRFQQPYDNLYIQAMPPQNDRTLLRNLLENPTVFPPELIYRSDDANFGVAQRVVYNHVYGLTAATLDDYVASLELNHYWKNLVLGQIKTAQAVDDNGQVIYEVVYSEVVDDLTNAAGETVGKIVVLPFPLNANTLDELDVVYPNGLEDMRNQVIDQIGQVSNVLPRWMLSRQDDGRVLGFTPSWVIAYTNPGQSGQIAYNIQQYFDNRPTLNLVDFEADRYELDGYLTKNWDREQQHWVPQPPTVTTFDTLFQTWAPPETPTLPTPQYGTWGNYNEDFTEFTPVGWVNVDGDIVVWTNDYNGEPTIFDGGSMQFIAPVDMYENNTQVYDKYLMFPKRNILE